VLVVDKIVVEINVDGELVVVLGSIGITKIRGFTLYLHQSK